MNREQVERVVSFATADRQRETGLHVSARNVMSELDKAIPDYAVIDYDKPAFVDAMCAAIKAAEEGKMAMPYEFPTSHTKPLIDLAQQRQRARRAGDYVRADAIRSDLTARGVTIQDVGAA